MVVVGRGAVVVGCGGTVVGATVVVVAGLFAAAWAAAWVVVVVEPFFLLPDPATAPMMIKTTNAAAVQNHQRL